MKIAILGTRGIPNNYGGFEQCAEKLSLHLLNQGHEIIVYNPKDHPYVYDEWQEIKIKRIFSNEKKLRSLNLFLYDYLCLKDALKQDFDIILELGYSPCSLFYYLKKNNKVKIVTNMDGLDWKREKWGFLARYILKYSEKLAAIKSYALVADNMGIRNYILEKYKIKSNYIPYGAEFFNVPDDIVLKNFNLEKYSYHIVVSRLEPENNIETILDGYILSGTKEQILLIGDNVNKYGNFLMRKYKSFITIQFVGGIYDYKTISTLRWYSKVYFHGHSVGGTNPSLLEAMASNAFIVAHNNIFNKNVLGRKGCYFSTSNDIAEFINNYNHKIRETYIKRNRNKIKNIYSWHLVAGKYEKLFERLVKITT